jgi:hypothetical protein
MLDIFVLAVFLTAPPGAESKSLTALEYCESIRHMPRLGDDEDDEITFHPVFRRLDPLRRTSTGKDTVSWRPRKTGNAFKPSRMPLADD